MSVSRCVVGVSCCAIAPLSYIACYFLSDWSTIIFFSLTRRKGDHVQRWMQVVGKNPMANTKGYAKLVYLKLHMDFVLENLANYNEI